MKIWNILGQFRFIRSNKICTNFALSTLNLKNGRPHLGTLETKLFWYQLFHLMPNLKNLSRGLNLSHRSNMVGFTSSIQDLSCGGQLKPVFGGFETRHKFIKFGILQNCVYEKMQLKSKTIKKSYFLFFLNLIIVII